MIKKSQFILVLLLVCNTIYSQEKYLPVNFITNTSNNNDENYLPVKNFYKIEELFEDNIFNSIIKELNINFTNYKFIDRSDIVSFKDSLIINKVSYKSKTIKILYNKNLGQVSINRDSFLRLYNDKYPKNYKIMSLNRTTELDENNNYIIYIYYLE